MTATDARQRGDGWPNTCTLPIPGTREICGLRYFYLSHKQRRMAIGPDGEPTTEPHVCRRVELDPTDCPRGCGHHATAEHKNGVCIWCDCGHDEAMAALPPIEAPSVQVPVTIEAPTVARVALDGTVTDTQATEAELNGWRASQGALFDRGRPVRAVSKLQGALL